MSEFRLLGLVALKSPSRPADPGTRADLCCTLVLGADSACTARKNVHQRTILPNRPGKNPESDESLGGTPVNRIRFRGNRG